MTRLPARIVDAVTLGVAAGLVATMASAQAPAPRTPVAPTRTEIKSVDQWEVTCLYGQDDKKIGCNAILRVYQQDPAASENAAPPPPRVIMVWALSKPENGALVSTFQTPTGLRVAPGLDLKLDGGAAHTVPFDSCGTAACLALTTMDAGFIKQLSTATKVDATIQGVDGRAYTFTFNPKGVDKAIAAVR